MWEVIVQFFVDNSSAIVVSLIVGVIFFILGPLGLWFSGKKIRRERTRKAKETLIDLFEGMVVNQAQADEKKLKSMLRAVERDIDIDLTGEYSLDEWLEDVVLRFERSRHLSADQKQAYYDSVRKISEEIAIRNEQKPKSSVPRDFKPIIDELKITIDQNDVKRGISLIEELEQVLAKRTEIQDPIVNIFRIYKRFYQRSPVTFVASMIFVLVLYMYLVFRVFPASISF